MRCTSDLGVTMAKDKTTTGCLGRPGRPRIAGGCSSTCTCTRALSCSLQPYKYLYCTPIPHCWLYGALVQRSLQYSYVSYLWVPPLGQRSGTLAQKPAKKVLVPLHSSPRHEYSGAALQRYIGTQVLRYIYHPIHGHTPAGTVASYCTYFAQYRPTWPQAPPWDGPAGGCRS
jgi:hypothetical protein